MIERIRNKNGNILNGLNEFLSSKLFPFMTATVSLLCYYLGLDIVFIYYVGITGLVILLFCDDISPLITVLLFMCVLVSYENSPSNLAENAPYYFQTEILVQIFIVIGLLGTAVIYRFISTCASGRFTVSPIFFGLCAFAAALFINGIFSDGYSTKNLVYGLVMALCFLGIFTILKDNLSTSPETFEKLALSFFALSLVLVCELTLKYLTCEELFVDGNLNREQLTFGWGMWNTMGMMLLICLPSTLYLAGKYKRGFIFTVYSAFLFAAVWASCSRQAMLGSAIIYPTGLIILLIKGNNRKINIGIILCALCVGVSLLFVFRDSVFRHIKELILQLVANGEITGSGRTSLWKGGFEYFKSSPVFGVGFYSDLYADYLGGFNGFSGMSFIPHMCHNTVIQLMSACGIVGLITYLVHRVQTVISFFRNVTYDRTFIALTMLSLIGLSLVDNHLFNIFPTIIYACLTAVLCASGKREKTK